MIGISTVLFDLNGHVELLNANILNPNTVQMTRRVNKTKTLDGGVFVSDFGYNASDENIEVVAHSLSKEVVELLKNILRFHSRLILTTVDGAFYCILSNIRHFNNETNMLFVLIEEA